MAAMNVQKKVNFHLKKGALHDQLHIAPGQKIPAARLKKALSTAKKTHNVTLERRVDFALNAKKFNH